jgi:hypothetical protein
VTWLVGGDRENFSAGFEGYVDGQGHLRFREGSHQLSVRKVLSSNP